MLFLRKISARKHKYTLNWRITDSMTERKSLISQLDCICFLDKFVFRLKFYERLEVRLRCFVVTEAWLWKHFGSRIRRRNTSLLRLWYRFLPLSFLFLFFALFYIETQRSQGQLSLSQAKFKLRLQTRAEPNLSRPFQ